MKTDAAALPALYDSLAERMGDPANFAPLTPISFLSRTADVHPEHESLVGGSVKPDNAATLFGQPDIDGGLIGGAALDADAFLAICRSAG